jgi:hypothetical protein
MIDIWTRLRLIRWRLGARRCFCGEQLLAPRTTVELAGVKHRTDGPCFHCDPYGDPL